MYNAAGFLTSCQGSPTIVRCTNADAAALVVVALVDGAHLEPGQAFSVTPARSADAPLTFTITAPLPLDVADQIGALPDTNVV